MPITTVDFDLPAGESVLSAYNILQGRIKAVEFTRDGATAQAGFAFNWAVTGTLGSYELSADIYSDEDLDIDSGSGPTLTVSGLVLGSLTVASRTATPTTQTLLLPLFF